MANTFIIWDIEIPGETLRFSNRTYIPPGTGDSYRASWERKSLEAFMILQMNHEIKTDQQSKSSTVSSGGVVPRKPTALVVQNNYPQVGDTERELDYLFNGGPNLIGSTVRCRISTVESGIPTLGQFTDLFNGVVSKEPKNGVETITFEFESTAGDLRSPILDQRFNGMGGHWLWIENEAPLYNDGNPPPMYGGVDWSLQIYYRRPTGSTAVQLFSAINTVSSNGLRLITVGTNMVLEVNLTDQYVLHTFGPSDLDTWVFTTVSFDATNAKLNAWKNDQHTLVDGTILNNPTGVDDKIRLGNTGAAPGYDVSSARIWSRVLSSEDIEPRLRWIEHRDEDSLEAAWEFIERRDSVVTDFSGKRRHISLASDSGWGSYPLHGEKEQSGKIIPLVLGYGFGVPLVFYDRRLHKALPGVATEDIYHVYVNSMPLLSDRDIGVGDLEVNHITGTIAMPTQSVFGIYTVQGQDIVISGAGIYNGTYLLNDQTPSPYGLPREGLGDNLTLVLDNPGFPSSGTAVGATVSFTPGSENWEILDNESPYHTAGNSFLQSVQFEDVYPDNSFCDCHGDPEILANITAPIPGYFYPPSALANVVAQILYTYGPRWGITEFPIPEYDLDDYRVGAYVNQESDKTDITTDSVLNELLSGCLTGLIEDEDGVFALQGFEFPEDAPGSNVIYPDSVIDVENLSQNLQKPEALRVSYKKQYSPQPAKDVPELVDPDIKVNVGAEWRTVRVGDQVNASAVLPTFFTNEIREERAREIGETVLRLSQGNVWKVTIRATLEDMKNGHLNGEQSSGDLSKWSMGDVLRVVLSRAILPGKGQMVIWLWSD